MAFNPAQQAQANAKMTKGQMQQFGTLTDKQKKDLANRERAQRDNSRAMADRAKLAAGAGAQLQQSGDPMMYAGQHDVTTPLGQETYLASIQGDPKKTGAGSYNMSSEKNEAAREQAKGQAAAQAAAPTRTPAKKPAGGSGGASSASGGWRDRVRAGTASDADMQEAFKAYQNGQYTPGPKTLEYFKKMGWLNANKPQDTSSESVTQKMKGGYVSGLNESEIPDYKTAQSRNYDMWKAQTGEWADTFDSIQKQFIKAGRSPEEAKDLADKVSQEMYMLGMEQGGATKENLRALQAKYGLRDISGSATDKQIAHLINKSHSNLAKNWVQNPDGSYTPSSDYSGDNYGWF